MVKISSKMNANMIMKNGAFFIASALFLLFSRQLLRTSLYSKKNITPRSHQMTVSQHLNFSDLIEAKEDQISSIIKLPLANVLPTALILCQIRGFVLLQPLITASI